MADSKNKEIIEEKEVVIKKISIWKRMWQWWLSLFKEEYELIVWFHSETIEHQDGLKTIKRSQKTFMLKAVTKKTSTHIVGKDIFGKPFEIKTVEPFDYQLRKLM